MSKSKSGKMKSKAKRELKPKLRFPEFRDAPAWKPAKVDSFCNSFSGGTPDTSTEKYYGGDIPFIRSAEVNTAEIELSLTEEGLENSAAKLVHKGDVLVALYGANSGDVGLARVDGAINQAILCLQSTASNEFLYQYLNSRQAWIVAKYLQGGQGNLSGDIIKSVRLHFPLPDEQQKIADCLSSLDELIAAHSRKLDALKAHKKGLMQQLFPCEGETLPRLRLPEFKDAPEWEVKPLGKLFDTTTGGTPDRSNEDYWGGEVPWITTSLVDFNTISVADEFLTEEGLENSSAKIFPEETILLALYGQGITRGKVALLRIAAATNQACGAILPSEEIEPQFTFLYLCSRYDELRGLSNSGGQKNLSQGIIREFPFAYPKDTDEQNRIVDCFTSLNALVESQSEKLDALFGHKKGLMQQLFPSLESKA